MTFSDEAWQFGNKFKWNRIAVLYGNLSRIVCSYKNPIKYF